MPNCSPSTAEQERAPIVKTKFSFGTVGTEGIYPYKELWCPLQHFLYAPAEESGKSSYLYQIEAPSRRLYASIRGVKDLSLHAQFFLHFCSVFVVPFFFFHLAMDTAPPPPGIFGDFLTVQQGKKAILQMQKVGLQYRRGDWASGLGLKQDNSIAARGFYPQHS